MSDAADDDRARIHFVDAGDEVEEGRLARAGRTHEGEELALFDGKGDVRQHRHPRAPPPVGLGHVIDFDDRLSFPCYFCAIFTFEPSLRPVGGLTTTLSPAFTPWRTSTISPR